VVLGPMVERAALDGATARVVVNDVETRVEDPEALPGAIADLLAHVAALLPAFGEELRPGDVVITGSIVPPLAVAAGDRVAYELVGIGSVSISF
jgi:2-keto-4-pentenoate hydratase